MNIHHVSCGTGRPFGVRLFSGLPPNMVCHCLIVQSGEGLVLVDTGFSVLDFRQPYRRLGLLAPFLSLAVGESEAAVRQVELLRFDPGDVSDIVLTHLDLDHAGGLRDFPEARVHAYEPEHSAAMLRKTMKERIRYRPGQFAHGPKWVVHRAGRTVDFFGIEALQAGLPGGLLLVPLIGHTRGHCGVAVPTGDRWLLHVGDTYYNRAEIGDGPLSRSRLYRQFLRQIHVLPREAFRTRARIRELAEKHGDEVTIFSSHDPEELQIRKGDRTSCLSGSVLPHRRSRLDGQERE